MAVPSPVRNSVLDWYFCAKYIKKLRYIFCVTPIEPQDGFLLAFVIVFYNKHRTFPVDPVFLDWVMEFLFSVCDFLINSLDLTLFRNPVAIDLKSTFTPVNDVV